MYRSEILGAIEVTLDTPIIINALLAAVNLLGGWVLKSMYQSIRDLREGQSKALDNQLELERRIVSDFARRDDVKAMFSDLLEAIRRVEDKVDGTRHG